MSARVKVGVIGGSGYIGGELLRYLAGHPRVRVDWVTANSRVGEEIAAVLPNLRGAYGGRFVPLEEGLEAAAATEAVFVCLPHNRSQEVLPNLIRQAPETVYIDMGGDFRTNDPAGYEAYYKKRHAAPELLPQFVYGFTEFHRERIAGSKRIANPGCFATTLNLALAPLARAGKLSGAVFATGITGSSGAGNKPLDTTHHPERATNVRAYKPLVHQHVLEVEGFLRGLTDEAFQLHFVPQSGPFVRGIFATVFTPQVDGDTLTELFSEAYASEPLVHVVEGSPQLRWVQGTPRSFVGIAGGGDAGVLFSITDNLGKGAAGQALQNFNLALGFPETAGLSFPGGFV